jgi:hypothetical protein
LPPWVSGLTPRGLNLGGLNRALPPSDPFVCFADAVLRLIFGLIGARAGGAMVRATLKKKWWVRRAGKWTCPLALACARPCALAPGAGPCLAVALFSRLTYELCVMSATNVSHSLGHTYVTVFTCSPHSPAVDPGSPPGGGDSRPVHSTMR